MNEQHYEKIGRALDRFQEAHFWIHMMEQHYHYANPFRWYLNVFLKAIKEVPDLIQMAMQNEKDFTTWFHQEREVLRTDPLLKVFFKNRDLIVHRDMLVPKSSGTIGITEGKGFKSGVTLPIHPLEDSDDAILRYARHFSGHDFLGLTTPDEDSAPCVYRQWRINDFDEELVDLCATAWLKVGNAITAVLHWQGTNQPPLIWIVVMVVSKCTLRSMIVMPL